MSSALFSKVANAGQRDNRQALARALSSGRHGAYTVTPPSNSKAVNSWEDDGAAAAERYSATLCPKTFLRFQITLGEATCPAHFTQRAIPSSSTPVFFEGPRRLQHVRSLLRV